MIKGRDKTWIHNQRGQSTIEFALILPLKVLFIAGIINLGQPLYSSIAITNADREGERYGTLNPKLKQGICDRTITEAQSSGITLNHSGVTDSCSSTVTYLSSDTSVTVCNKNQPIKVNIGFN